MDFTHNLTGLIDEFPNVYRAFYLVSFKFLHSVSRCSLILRQIIRSISVKSQQSIECFCEHFDLGEIVSLFFCFFTNSRSIKCNYVSTGMYNMSTSIDNAFNPKYCPFVTHTFVYMYPKTNTISRLKYRY